MKEIVFAGFGGQGVLTGGLIIAYMAAGKDLNTIWMPAYGPAMRGGKANCVVKYGDNADEKIGSPIMEEADVLIAMNEPSLDFLKFCKPDADVFVNADAISDDYKYPEGICVTKINCLELATQAKNAKGQNLVMMGSVIKKCGLFDEKYAVEKMCEFFANKGKGAYNEANIKAVQAGFEAAQESFEAV